MQNARINPKQRKFLRLYLGRNPELHGNATRCYKAVYGDRPDHLAYQGASRLINRPAVKQAIEDAEAEAQRLLTIDAAWVKYESMRLYRRAMGDEAIPEITITEEAGQERIQAVERYEYDPTTARHSLRLIGEHKDVQAFQQTVEHKHTHRLEQMLSQRSREIEGTAVDANSLDEAERPPALEHKSKKGSIQTKGPADADAQPDDPLSERAGATDAVYKHNSK